MANIVKVVFGVDISTHTIEVPPSIKKGDKIILKLENGNDIVNVVTNCYEGKPDDGYAFLRVATDLDIHKQKQKDVNNAQIKEKVNNIIKKHKINLKLIKVHESFDNSKVLIVYTAPERVDFRDLVKELASVFKTHIEMRQINDRECACILGLMAECGQELCCRRFLYDPKAVTIKMAKAQDVALNPNKINGLCGKLRCCLNYEYGQYKEMLEVMPELNSVVNTPLGIGEVVYRDLLREKVSVKLNNEEIQDFNLKDIQKSA